MPPNRAQSKRKVVPSRRAYENTILRSTARPTPPRTLKRQSRTPEHIDLTSKDPPDLESKQQVSRKPPKPHEPLPTKYTLRPKAFDYAGFIGDEAQKTSEYCARLGREVSIRTSRAKIVYNKKESSQSDINSLQDWRLLDEVAGSCLKDKSKKDVQLSWAITYQLKASSVEPEREALELYEDESEDDAKDDDEEAEKTRSSKKNTATNYRLAEARAAPHSITTNQLLELYRCGAPNCRDSAAYCLPVGGLNSGRYPLSTHTIRQWVLAVEEGMTTIHNPPVPIWNSIMNMQKAQKSTPLPPSTAASAPSPFALPAPPPYYPPYALPVPVPFGPAGPYGMPAEALNRSKAAGSATRPSSSESIVEPRSSPTDPLTLTRQYIAWYREKFPEQEALMDKAADRIELAAYSLDGMMELRAEDWRRIGVPEGLGRRLAGNIVKFRRQRNST